jgi:hypothetical protein
MKLLLTTLEGGIFPIEVSPDLEVINLKALCEQETSIPLGDMSLSHDGKVLGDDNKSLVAYSIKENDIIMVQKLQGFLVASTFLSQSKCLTISNYFFFSSQASIYRLRLYCSPSKQTG